MTFIIRKGAHSAANAQYQIARSLRFNSPDTAYLNRTPGSAGTRNKWTWSGWVKRGKLDSGANYQFLFSAGTTSGESSRFYFGFLADCLVFGYGGADYRVSTAVFRDTSAWMHLVIAYDSTQVTAADRCRVWATNFEITSWSTNNAITINTLSAITNNVAHSFGRDTVSPSNTYFDGLVAEAILVDGAQLTPASFGQTNSVTGVWEPKAFAGSYGTTGYRLDFSDNSGTTSSTLGKDRSGNGNDWTPNNFSVSAGVGNDSITDTPTNYGTETGVGGEVRGNYCVLDPLNSSTLGTVTLLNGNLDANLSRVGSNSWVRGNWQIPSSGKWWFAGAHISTSSGTQPGNPYFVIGVVDATTGRGIDPRSTAGAIRAWDTSGGSGASKTDGSGLTAFGSTSALLDEILAAVDMDNGWIDIYKQGVLVGGGHMYTDLLSSGKSWQPFFAFSGNNVSLMSLNFGQRALAFPAPAGFKALCTQNLPDPVIVNPKRFFGISRWTGTGATKTISDLDFQLDFSWIKCLSTAGTYHALMDTARGISNIMSTNLTAAETSLADELTAVTSTGFTLGASAGGYTNFNARTFVGWSWKKGAIPGFDMVTYNGTLGATAVVNISHSLLGVAPDVIIHKSRNVAGSDGGQWALRHRELTNWNYYLRMQTTDGEINSSGNGSMSAPTSTTFGTNWTSGINTSSNAHIAYLWSEVAGFSRFRKYIGTGSSDGPFIWCGFRPRWVLIKRTDSASDWILWDTARDTLNIVNNEIFPNSSGAEAGAQADIDIVSNGFKLRRSGSALNASGGVYIFMAFAENPFKYARAR